MIRSLRWWWALVALGVLAACGGPTRDVVVREVVDGDTIVVQGASGAAFTVRILGVDTPETKKPGVPVQCFGPEASAFTKAWLTGARVTLRFDVERHDKYGRTLASVRAGGRDVGATLLAEGYARVLVIAPNGRDAKDYLARELNARRDRLGLWGACPRA